EHEGADRDLRVPGHRQDRGLRRVVALRRTRRSAGWLLGGRMMLLRGLALTLGLSIGAFSFAQGKWVKLAPFPEPAEELLGAADEARLARCRQRWRQDLRYRRRDGAAGCDGCASRSTALFRRRC